MHVAALVPKGYASAISVVGCGLFSSGTQELRNVDGGGEDALCDSGSEYDLATHTRDHLTHANHSRDAAPAGSLISLWIGAIFGTRLCRTSTRTHGHAHGMVPSVHASNRPTPGFWTQWRICHSCAF